MIMTLQELSIRVRKEFDRRNLNSDTRYRALDKIVLYIKEYHNENLSVLQKSKSDFKSQYENYKKSIGQAFSSAESSAINEIYNQLDSSAGLKSYTIPVQPDEIIDVSAEIELDTLLNPKNFEPVSNLNESLIPDTPGLYAIRIKDISMIPQPFSNELQKRGHDILYIGKASNSLRERLWHQELNHKNSATFFRSIGAILGFRPIRGSLYGKDTRNYKFSIEDTNIIKSWIKDNLLINIQIQQDNIEDTETSLIQKYHPIINISKNPYKMTIMSVLRDECVKIAKEK